MMRDRFAPSDFCAAALDEQRKNNRRLGEILVERGWLFPEDISRALAAQYGLDYVDIRYSSVDARAASMLDPEVGQRLCAIPVRFLPDGGLLIAVADPTSAGLAEIRATLAGRVGFAVAEASDVRQAWRALTSGYRR